VAPALIYTIKTNDMNLVKTLEGGLKNPASLALLQEAFKLINSKPVKAEKKVKGHTELFKKIQNISTKKGLKTEKAVKQVGKLLASTGYLGLSGVGKKKNAIVRGGLLGAAAGLVSLFLKNSNTNPSEQKYVNGVSVPQNEIMYHSDNKLLTFTLYTLGGIIAGVAIKKLGNNKKIKKWFKKNKTGFVNQLKDFHLN
jgi:hypothetical protein